MGPDRLTHTIERPADRVTFNSITNNPNYGDERNFVLIKDAAHAEAGGWSHSEIEVVAGHEYVVRMYVHNNAADSLALSAENTRVSATVLTTTGNQLQIDGFVESNSAEPSAVYDHVMLLSVTPFNVAYVADSAVYRNNANPDPGFRLSDSIVTSNGALIGYEQMDGDVPGCFEYSGVATFRVRVRGETV